MSFCSRIRRGTLAGSLAAFLLVGAAAGLAAAARLEAVRGRGALRLCANPAALPYSSRSGENGLAGFQPELAQAIAAEMGLGLAVAWAPGAARSGGCDLTLDQVPSAARYEREGLTGPLMGRATLPLRFSKPYSAGGVYLIIPPSSHAHRRFDRGRMAGGQRSAHLDFSVPG
jgi:ABC-type amino acid transport substrate-binding protein